MQQAISHKMNNQLQLSREIFLTDDASFNAVFFQTQIFLLLPLELRILNKL